MEQGEFKNTELAKARIGDIEYKGRRIIGRDEKINGGVYIGSGKREAIVVDFDKDPELNRLLDEVKQMCLVNGFFDKSKALSSVFNVVREAMYASSEEVEYFIDENNLGNDHKVQLGVFIKEGIGVCRHQNLACAAILEQLVDEGLLSGTVSIDRNTTDYGGHAWCRYTSSTGEVYVLDVAQNKIGALAEMQQTKYDWNYNRPNS